MRKITAICFCLLLFPATFQRSPFIGGVDTAFAQAYGERWVFEVTIENNVSKVNTMMAVFAYSEQDARDQVTLNGWTVTGVNQLTEKEARQYNFSTDTVNTFTPSTVRIEPSVNNGIGNTPIKSGSTGTEDTTGYPPIKPRVSVDNGSSNNNIIEDRVNPVQIADNLNLLPTSPDLEFVLAYYFDLGNIEPISNPLNSSKMRGLDKNVFYVIFGHADEVPVGDKAAYGNNFELSFKRAEYIRNMMVNAGFPANNVRVVGLGANYPTVENEKTGVLANRRVEIYGFRTQK